VLADNVDDPALNVGKALPDQRRVDDLAVQRSELELRMFPVSILETP
jgi:hypothetical protein